MTKNAFVSQVFEASKGCAPDMTHALRSLGGGSMGIGIAALYDVGWEAGCKAGQKNAAIQEILIFMVLSFGAGIGVFLHKHHQKKLADNKLETDEEE